MSAPITRRRFLMAAAGSAVLFMSGELSVKAKAAPVFALPPLPFAESALEPVISARHHRIPSRQAPQGLRRQPQ